MFATRMFAPMAGVPEDAATGSSASCLAHYLRYYDVIDDCGMGWLGLDQGYSIGRPSLLMLRANRSGEDIEVNIGGSVVFMARGGFEVAL
jgi:trans-2,3-dihydro-3-hydroxyanthranilate isomerase